MSHITSIREKRMKSQPKPTQYMNLSSKLKLSVLKQVPESLSNLSVNTSRIIRPYPKLKALSIPRISISKLNVLQSTRTTKKIKFSMYSPSNNSLSTSRKRNGDSFNTPNQRTLRLPVSSDVFLKNLSEKLTDFEKFEIVDQGIIYFYASNTNKIIPNQNLTNWGFDNEKGDYIVIVGDSILYRYEILCVLGKGTFGKVCKCFDHKNKEIVAVKIIKNKKNFNKQAVVEVKILRYLNENDPKSLSNIIKMKNAFVFREHVCIVFELLSISLFDLLKSNDFQGFPVNVASKFAVQMLIGLKFCKELGVIHCDLKPENILLKVPNKCGIKIIDFGSGCLENECVYTYIQSRFYRAPEIMLGIPYDQSIDIWSFGCILFELVFGYPLFPGESESDQFLRISEILGDFPNELLKLAERKIVFFDENNLQKIVPDSKGKIRVPGSKNFKSFFEDEEDSELVDFFNKIFTWEPYRRISPAEAIFHPWIQKSLENLIKKRKKNSNLKTFR